MTSEEEGIDSFFTKKDFFFTGKSHIIYFNK